MVMAESIILENIETGKLDKQCRCFKSKVLDGHKADGTDQTFEKRLIMNKPSYLHIKAHHI